MTIAIHAVFVNGVFRPTQPVDLPDRCEVELELRAVRLGDQTPRDTPERPSLDELYAILGKRFHSGERDVAARHDEHQP